MKQNNAQQLTGIDFYYDVTDVALIDLHNFCTANDIDAEFEEVKGRILLKILEIDKPWRKIT